MPEPTDISLRYHKLEKDIEDVEFMLWISQLSVHLGHKVSYDGHINFEERIAQCEEILPIMNKALEELKKEYFKDA